MNQQEIASILAELEKITESSGFIAENAFVSERFCDRAMQMLDSVRSDTSP